MPFPKLEESLCGCSLRTGSKIIGWISVVFCIMSLLILIILACTDVRNFSFLFEPNAGHTSYHKVSSAVIFLTIVLATTLIIAAIFNVLLLVGVYNDRPRFIQAWIVFETSVTVVYLITIISSTIEKPDNTFMKLVILSVTAYCVFIVNSYNLNLKQSRQLTAPPSYN